MKKFKKILRLLFTVLIIAMALVGFGAPASFNKREEYQDEEIKTEQLDETKVEVNKSREGDHIQ